MDSLINEYFDAAHKGLLSGNATKPATLKVAVPLATASGLLVATPDPRQPVAAAASVLRAGPPQEPPAVAAGATAGDGGGGTRLRERLRVREEELSLVRAKKESLKKKCMELEKAKSSLEARLEIYYAEASSTVEESKYWRTRAEEAVKAMSGMRDYHTQEVKLLQRALLAASGRAQFRISDTAELIERLGRAVIQRDEALRERTKLQDITQQVKTEFAAILKDRNRLNREIKTANAKIAKVEKMNRALLKGGSGGVDGESSEVSDFERELRSFERRYAVLGEGVEGADHVVKTQEAEIRKLSIRLNICEADNESLRRDVQHWRGLLLRKDEEIEALRQELGSVDERLNGAGRAEAEAVEKASRMEKELSKTIVEMRKYREAANSMEQTINEETAEQIVNITIYSALDKDEFTNEIELIKPIQLVTHTGEIVQVSIIKYEKSGKFAIKAVDCDVGDTFLVHLDPEIVDKLLSGTDEHEGEEDVWHELIYSVGFSREPVKTLVLPSLVIDQSLFLQPADLPLSLKIYRYDSRRWYVAGFDEILQRVVDLRVLLDEKLAALAAGDAAGVLLKRLRLTEHEDESLVLKFEY